VGRKEKSGLTAKGKADTERGKKNDQAIAPCPVYQRPGTQRRVCFGKKTPASGDKKLRMMSKRQLGEQILPRKGEKEHGCHRMESNEMRDMAVIGILINHG